MCRLRTLAVIAVTLGAAAAPSLASGAAAGASAVPAIAPLRLDYTIYAGGLRALALNLRVMTEPPDYRLQAQVRTTGFLSRIVSFVLEAQTAGRAGDKRLVPGRYATANRWRERDIRRVTMRYGRAPVPAVTAVPPSREDDRGRVPESERRNTVDPLTGIFNLLLADRAACDGTARIFDGRRRYDISARPDGSGRIAPSGYSVYSGRARICRLSVTTIGGFWDSVNERKRYPDAVRVWLAEAAEDAPPVPVRFQMDTGYAAVVGHLTGIHRGTDAALPETPLDTAAEIPSTGGSNPGEGGG